MLHGALPRAYLGYFDQGHHHPFAAYAQHHDSIASTTTQLGQVYAARWEAALAEAHRLRSPSPLDLSIRPTRHGMVVIQAPSTPGTTRTENEDEDEDLVVDDDLEQKFSIQLKERQLLQTPSHHHHHQLMTPPNTPSPPQVPRKRGLPLEELQVKPPRPKKKHARRLKFDEDTSSPVSGTVILGADEALVSGDIDPAFNVVEVTEEARAELAKIENRLGPYQCKLCQQMHDDAFQLAQHRCSRIAHVEYRCPECEKRFSCPANLASHRRWHKPRPSVAGTALPAENGEISCGQCEAKFTKHTALRKHLTIKHPSAAQTQIGVRNDDNNNMDQQLGLAVTSLSDETD